MIEAKPGGGVCISEGSAGGRKGGTQRKQRAANNNVLREKKPRE